MKKNVVMFQLPVQEFKSIKRWGNIPLAASMLKAMALKEGLAEYFDIEILPPDVVNHAGDAWLIDYLVAKHPDVLCASLYFWNSQRSIYIAEQLKKRLPDLLFVVGGPEISKDTTYIMENQNIDFGCIGEGEEAFVAILRAIADNQTPPAVPGLFWRQGKKLSLNQGCSIVKNLDLLPSFLKMGILDLKNKPIVPYETMRGCTYSCLYCATGTLPWRCFSADRVINDLAILHENGVKKVHLFCSNFLRHPDFFTICSELAAVNADRGMSLSFTSYAEDVSREKAEALKACNFEVGELGLQTVNKKTLKIIRRPPLNKSRFLEGLGHLKSAGIDFHIDLIAGLPGESIDDVERSIAFMKKYRIQHYNIFALRLLPGSPLWERARELGIHAQSLPPHLVTATRDMTQGQINSCSAKETTKEPDLPFELAYEFQLPRFCALDHAENALSGPCQTNLPISKLLVSCATDMERFAGQSVRKYDSTLVIFFSNIGQSLLSFNAIIEAICRANPFCRIMPVFEIKNPADMDDVLQQCKHVTRSNIVQKTIIKDGAFSIEQATLPEGFTLYEQISIHTPDDMERVNACKVFNVMADISPDMDPEALFSVLKSLSASKRNVRFKNIAFYYLDNLVRQRLSGKKAQIHAPVDFGAVAQLDEKGGLLPHLTMSNRKVLEIAHMQWRFLVQNT